MSGQTTTLSREYQRFELHPGASEEEINASFRRLSKRVHPDVGGSPELFDELRASRERLLRAARGEALEPPPVPEPVRRPQPPERNGLADLLAVFDGSQPVWVLGTIVALPVVILGGLAAVIRLDRSLIAGSLVAGLAVFVLVCVAVGVGRQHKVNTRPEVIYRSAEEVVRLRAQRIRDENRRRAAERASRAG